MHILLSVSQGPLASSPYSDMNIFAQPQHAQPPHRTANEHQQRNLPYYNVFRINPRFSCRSGATQGPCKVSRTYIDSSDRVPYLFASSEEHRHAFEMSFITMPPRQAVQVEHGHRLQTVAPSVRTPEPCWDRLLPKLLSGACMAGWLAPLAGAVVEE